MTQAPALQTVSTTARQPTYRLRRGYGQAIVTLADSATGKRKDYWLGEVGSPESHQQYRKVLQQWETLGRRLPLDGGRPLAVEVPSFAPAIPVVAKRLTIGQLIDAYGQYADGTFKSQTCATIHMVLNLLKQSFGSVAAEDFG